jgi:hypothetical protein
MCSFLEDRVLIQPCRQKLLLWSHLENESELTVRLRVVSNPRCGNAYHHRIHDICVLGAHGINADPVPKYSLMDQCTHTGL